MVFRIVDSGLATSDGNEVLLVLDRWNDWYTWVTQFHVVVVKADNTRVNVGNVKIAFAGMTTSNPVTSNFLTTTFPRLNAPWFSIGQDENYYETLNDLGDQFRDTYLSDLRDVARDLALLEEHAGEEVFRRSLLRDIDLGRVRTRFHALATGNLTLTNFAFRFKFPPDSRVQEPPPELTFQVTPNSSPPSNVHVVIGRNGVGKTRCFDYLSRTFLGLRTRDGGSPGTLEPLNTLDQLIGKGHGFAGLVTASFSPFDEYGPLVASTAGLEVKYSYIGLIREVAESTESRGTGGQDDPSTLTIKGRPELTKDFLKSLEACRVGARRKRLSTALEILEADPLFEEATPRNVLEDAAPGWEERARVWFRRLSSGHSVVLLTIMKLVELVEEKSLVLVDEPEGHLHPPLLSAFVRALSDLLINRNGVAIIATHSPVVLQEVPRSCAWVLNRSGLSSRVDRPDLETFGENAGVLTREVFGLEVVQTGFHRMITEAVLTGGYAGAMNQFGDRLGGEARALVRALSLTPPPVAPVGDNE